MAAQRKTFPLPEGAWVLITESGTAHAVATWSNKGYSTVTLQAMATETPPTDFEGSHDWAPGEGEDNRTLADLWPDITPAYLYANAQTGNGLISCNHAA